MVHRLRERADLVDERERPREVTERPGALNRIARARPARDLAETGRHLVLGEKGSPGHGLRRGHGGQKVGVSKSTLNKVNTGHTSGSLGWPIARSRSGSAR